MQQYVQNLLADYADDQTLNDFKHAETFSKAVEQGKFSPSQLNAFRDAGMLTGAQNPQQTQPTQSIDEIVNNVTPLSQPTTYTEQFGDDRYSGNRVQQNVYGTSAPSYNVQEVQQAAETIQNLGVPLQEGNKVYATINPAINEALYGPDIASNIAYDTPGFRTPRQYDTRFADYLGAAVREGVPALALSAATGGTGLLSTLGEAGATLGNLASTARAGGNLVSDTRDRAESNLDNVNNTTLTDSMFGLTGGAMDGPNPDETVGSDEMVDFLDADLIGNFERFEEWLARQEGPQFPETPPPPPPTEDAGGQQGGGDVEGGMERDPREPAQQPPAPPPGDNNAVGEPVGSSGQTPGGPGALDEPGPEEDDLDLESILDQFGDQWITSGMDLDGNLVTDPSITIRDGELVDSGDAPTPTFNGMAPDGGQITGPIPGSTGGSGTGDGTGDGSGSNSGVQQLAQAGKGLFGEGPEFEDFMASVQTEFPLLQRLGITPQQYLAMLFARLQNQGANT